MSFEGWKTYRLGDFIDINPKISLKNGSEYSFVEMKDLNANLKYTAPSIKRNFKGGSKFENGDTLFARITPCLENGKICQVKGLENGIGFGSTEFLVFRGKYNVSNTDFVYYLSRTDYVRNNAIQAMTGTSGRQRVEKNAIEDFEIIAPDLPTQTRIASILSSLDDKIELNRQTNQTLEAIAQTLFQEMCVPKGDELPEGWKETTFENEFDAERGLSYKGAGLAENDGIPMHNLNSIYEGGGFKTSGIKYYKGAYKEKNIVKPGDVIIANTEQGHKYRLIGFPAIVPKFYGDLGIYSHHIYKLTHKPKSYLTSDFAYHLLLRNEVREQVIGFANGTTVNMLKIDGLIKPTFIKPPKDIVKKFTAIAMANRLQVEANIEENQTLTALRDSLLPKLIKGEIEV